VGFPGCRRLLGSAEERLIDFKRIKGEAVQVAGAVYFSRRRKAMLGFGKAKSRIVWNNGLGAHEMRIATARSEIRGGNFTEYGDKMTQRLFRNSRSIACTRGLVAARRCNATW
jgi:hypothetical protein